MNGFLGFWIFRIGRFLRVVFDEKPVFNVCTKRPLTGKRAENIIIFFYAIGLRIFCSTLCAKFEKNRAESNEVAIRIILGKRIFCSTLCTKFEKNRTESTEVAIRIILGKKLKKIRTDPVLSRQPRTMLYFSSSLSFSFLFSYAFFYHKRIIYFVQRMVSTIKIKYSGFFHSNLFISYFYTMFEKN